MQIRRPIYIIEHLEPQLFEWCLIEYEHISETVGKENLWFTNIKNSADKVKLAKFGRVFSESVRKMNLSNACVLDPEATKTLKSEDAEKYSYFIFGGILGDYPPKKRTKKELTKFMPGVETRDIGKKQMSTDNAVYTTREILENGRKLSDLKFKDKLSIQLDKVEFVDLPYRYNIVNIDGKEKIYMSKKILKYLKEKGAFR